MTTQEYVINLLKIVNQPEIIGSAADPNILYASDVDLQQYLTVGNLGDIQLLEEFRKKYEIAYKDHNIMITDFKCGVYKSNPIRWNRDKIMNGYTIINNDKKVFFTDALNMESTIKMDIIALIDKEFVEFSCNYYITHDLNGKIHKSFAENTNDEIILSLQLDVYKYKNEGNYYKMLKRIKSLRMIKEQNVDNLTNFFNSKVGKLNHKLNALKTIRDVVEMDNIFTYNDFKKVLNHQDIYIKNASSLSELHDELSQVIDSIDFVVIDSVLKWLQKQ
jgi:predicted alpha/beta-fold hydrolase